MTEARVFLVAPDPAAPVPRALRALHDAALEEFSARDYRRALPLLGRLALALPPGHPLGPTVRGSLARAFVEVGNLVAAERELGHALAAEPDNPTFRAVGRMIRRAVRERSVSASLRPKR